MVHIETVKTDKFNMQYACFGKGKKTLVWIPGLSVQSMMIMAETTYNAFKILEDDDP